MPMSSTRAYQNHAISSTERRLNSSMESMPCRRMKRVTFAFSTYSGVGRQATSAIARRFYGGAEMMRRMELTGARVLLTGATGGLGEAIARALSERGAALVLSGRRVEALDALASELGATAVPCDLSDRAEVDRLADAAGDADVLVANAGLPGSGTLLK